VPKLLQCSRPVRANRFLRRIHVVPVPTTAMLIAIVPHLLYMGPVAGLIAVLSWNMGNRILIRSMACCSWVCCP